MSLFFVQFFSLYPTIAEFAKEKGWRCGKSFISHRSKCYRNPKTGQKLGYKYEINPKTGRRRKVKVGLNYQEYRKARKKALKKRGEGKRLTSLEQKYIADVNRLTTSTRKKKQRALDAKNKRLVSKNQSWQTEAKDATQSLLKGGKLNFTNKSGRKIEASYVQDNDVAYLKVNDATKNKNISKRITSQQDLENYVDGLFNPKQRQATGDSKPSLVTKQLAPKKQSWQTETKDRIQQLDKKNKKQMEAFKEERSQIVKQARKPQPDIKGSELALVRPEFLGVDILDRFLTTREVGESAIKKITKKFNLPDDYYYTERHPSGIPTPVILVNGAYVSPLTERLQDQLKDRNANLSSAVKRSIERQLKTSQDKDLESVRRGEKPGILSQDELKNRVIAENKALGRRKPKTNILRDKIKNDQKRKSIADKNTSVKKSDRETSNKQVKAYQIQGKAKQKRRGKNHLTREKKLDNASNTKAIDLLANNYSDWQFNRELRTSTAELIDESKKKKIDNIGDRVVETLKKSGLSPIEITKDGKRKADREFLKLSDELAKEIENNQKGKFAADNHW